MNILGFLGVDLRREDILRIREMSQEDRDSAIRSAIIKNYGDTKPFYKTSQSDTAFQMLSIMVDRCAEGISGSEIKGIIKMARKCW